MDTVQYITLAANTSQDYYTRNTLSLFTNRLPFIVQSNKENHLYVRLRSIAISPYLKVFDPLSQYIEISLSELAPQVKNNTFDHCLARVKYPPRKIYAHYAVQEFENAPFLELDTHQVSQLTISITNSVGNLLQLDGAPTLVVLEVSTRDMGGQFTMTCFSHLEGDSYAETNTLNDFTVSMPQTMKMSNYKMAITSIAFPVDVSFPPTPQLSFSLTHVEGGQSSEFLFDKEDFTDTEEFVEAIFTAVSEDDYFQDKVVVVLNTVQGSPFRDYLQLTVFLDDDDESILISFSEEFAIACGRNKNEVRTNISLSPSQVLNVGKPNLSLIDPSSLCMIYCSGIKPNIVGNELLPLLDIVPMEDQDLDSNISSIYLPEKLIFHDVISEPFRAMKFTLRQPNGQLQVLKSDSNASLIITLLFTPVD